MTLSNTQLGLCPRCGKPWHPLGLCWAYQLLPAEVIERTAARIYNEGFVEWDNRTRGVTYALGRWESEGGRCA